MNTEKIKELVRSIIDRGDVMSLATLDDSGVWVSDVMYVADDNLSLYWISEINVRHSKAIHANPTVAVSITTSRKGESSEGIQVSGVAEKIEGNIFEVERKLFEKKGGQEPGTPGEIFAGKVGYSWYKLTPKKIRLNSHKDFGHVKQDFL